jgi:uncharacterized C2H2 Zn-finger protein
MIVYVYTHLYVCIAPTRKRKAPTNDDEKWTCPYCDEVYSVKASYYKHLSRSHTQQWKKDKEKRKAETQLKRPRLSAAAQKKYKEKKVQCDILPCKGKLISIKSMTLHNAEFHLNRPDLPMGRRDPIYPREWDLDIFCDYCNKGPYKREWNYKVHLEKCTANEGREVKEKKEPTPRRGTKQLYSMEETKYKCDTCERGFSTSRRYELHLRTAKHAKQVEEIKAAAAEATTEEDEEEEVPPSYTDSELDVADVLSTELPLSTAELLPLEVVEEEEIIDFGEAPLVMVAGNDDDTDSVADERIGKLAPLDPEERLYFGIE